uniref:VP6 n=1 Tax=Ife virus TaxID=2547357 RepID=A0A482A5K8_9REOV|nr:VP6 [Ife virus]
MPAQTLLAPADIIKRNVEELQARGIKIHNATEKADDHGGTDNGGVVGGSVESDQKSEEDRKAVDGKRNSTGGKGEVAGGEGFPDNGVRASVDGDKRWGVATDEIAEVLRKTYKGEVIVGGNKVIILDKGLLEELGMGRDSKARQTDVVRNIRSNRGKEKRVTELRNIASLDELERVLDIKKDRSEKEKDISQTGVRIVSSLLRDVKWATAIVLVATGDEGWKDVKKEALKRPNIMQYVIEGEEIDREFLRLIDYL